MSQLTAIYDACVLYPAPLRSFLMYLAVTDLYRARWTNDIHEEWMRNVVKDHPDIERAQVEHIRDLMNAHMCWTAWSRAMSRLFPRSRYRTRTTVTFWRPRSAAAPMSS